jgi:hypothetical protein
MASSVFFLIIIKEIIKKKRNGEKNNLENGLPVLSPPSPVDWSIILKNI